MYDYLDLNWGNTRPNSPSSYLDLARYGVAPPQVMPDMSPINGVTTNDLSVMQGMNYGNQGGGSIWDGLLGENGWGKLALGGANSLFSGWLGMKQLDMAKERLKENKRQFNMNWNAQKNLTNSMLEDRQRRRVSAGGNAVGVDEYMAKWGVK